eukprot:gene4662-14858_t
MQMTGGLDHRLRVRHIDLEHLNATGPAGLTLYKDLHPLLSLGQVSRAQNDVAAWMVIEKLGADGQAYVCYHR